MVCYKICSVSIVFLSAMIYLTLFSDKTTLANQFMLSLSHDNQIRYKKIIEERKRIYITGFIYGLIISFGLLYTFHKKANKTTMVCFTVATSYIVMYLYYILSPKSDYIVLHLNNPSERQKWLDVYKHMQTNYHLGIAFGLVFVTLMSYGLI